MKVVISTVAYRGHYPRAVARMIERFNAVSHGYEIQAWVNTLPPGAPRDVVVGRWDYTGYCAKPFAMRAAFESGATQVILLDASFFPVRDIFPMVVHIQRNGYYLCNNGFKMGEWASDDALDYFGVSREESFRIPEVSSYCVGIDLKHAEGRGIEMLNQWCAAAVAPNVFSGSHTAPGGQGRNQGFVSTDPRVKGHRHDQTALSIIAHRLGMHDISERPYLTAYHEGYGGLYPNDQTVLVNHGVLEGWMEGKDVTC